MASHSGFEMNKIAGAIVLAGLIGMVSGKVAEYLYAGGPEHPGHEHEEARGYKVEVIATANAAGGAAKKGAANINALYASADVAKGGAFFAKKCAVCHTAGSGEPNKEGPNLWGVVNRQIASVGGFSYSKGLGEKSAEKWTFDNLNAFMYKPRGYAKGTIMAFAGVKKDQQRADLIAYLASLSGSPAALPTGE